MPKRLTIALFLGLLFSIPMEGQGIRQYEKSITKEFQQGILSYLADDMCRGRESGKPGGTDAAGFILDNFRKWNLQPVKWKMTQSFRHNDSIIVRNIYAMVPAKFPSDKYVIVSAHYDHLGTIRSKVYNGADDNASGVTVMLSLAKAFSQMRRDCCGPDKNILFVAFDGHEKSMCGSKWFASHLNELGIKPKQIECVVNIDIIGTNLEPVGSNPEFLIALGEETLPKEYRGLIKSYSQFPSYKMDVDLTFYGSRNFTQYVLNTGDQNEFRKYGIPAILFTSGFHRYTFKPTDDIDIIDFDLLLKRTLLIFNFTNSLCR